MDTWLYGSRYWCDECEVYHSVSCWMTDEDTEDGKYIVTDCDGDVVARYETLEEMGKDFEEYVEPLPEFPKTKRVKWHALLNPDAMGRWVDVVSVKRGGRWDADWRDNAVPVTDASVPQMVRDSLVIVENTSRIDPEYIKTLDDVLDGLSNLDGGVRRKNTLVISFYVRETI